jgi:hypothetical protein
VEAIEALEVEETTNQSLLRNFGERGQVPNLDRRISLRPSRHRQEAIASLGQPV